MVLLLLLLLEIVKYVRTCIIYDFVSWTRFLLLILFVFVYLYLFFVYINICVILSFICLIRWLIFIDLLIFVIVNSISHLSNLYLSRSIHIKKLPKTTNLSINFIWPLNIYISGLCVHIAKDRDHIYNMIKTYKQNIITINNDWYTIDHIFTKIKRHQ